MPSSSRRKVSRNRASKSDANPDALRTLRPNGEAPKSRIRTASQVHNISREMVDANKLRSARNERFYKAYKRFPPTDYSTLVELKMEDQSNVNWGMMAFIINNTRGSFYDMLAERGTACDIITKVGTPIEQRVYSELISVAYDQYAVREDYSYLLGHEISILEMGLYGKGIHMWEDVEGFKSDPCPARDFYVPEDTHISLEKFDLFMRKRKFHLHELWQRIEDEKAAEDRGWNVEAVKDAMRSQRDDWLNKYSNEDLMHDVVNGRMALTSVMKECVHVYDMYVREFDGTISRLMVLQDYMPLVNERKSGMGKGGGKLPTDDELTESVADECGFLLCKMGHAENIHQVVSVFLDNAGSGEWHDTPSLAEEIFVQCRQYDITMNSIMDAIKLNMTLMLQGQTAEATERLKSMVWGQFAVIPADTPFVQSRIQMDTTGATTSLQFMMSDLYSGIGHYRVQQQSPSGEAPTATQRQLDAAESAKLSGTQIRRYNEQQTIYHKERYRRFVSLTRGAEGYEQYEKFRDELKEMGVPEKAWKFENIRSITSNMIAGPGSPSYKMMAAEKIIALTNLTPKDDGQRAAIEDGIAALSGRQNVRRYMPPKKRVDPDMEERFIGLECETFSDPNLNPKNVQAFPHENHVRHIPYHLDDMASTVEKLEMAMKEGTLDEKKAYPGVIRLLHEGAHVGAHMKFLQRDEGKEAMFVQFSSDLNMIQKQVEKLQQNMQKMLDEKSQQKEFDPSSDPDIIKKLAMTQLEVRAAEQLAAIKANSISTQHQLREDATREKTATTIATTRARAKADIANKAAAAKAAGPTKPPTK